MDIFQDHELNKNKWSWEPHGEGWALYQGRTSLAHGANRMWVPINEFDSTGPKLRERIAKLLNDSENN